LKDTDSTPHWLFARAYHAMLDALADVAVHQALPIPKVLEWVAAPLVDTIECDAARPTGGIAASALVRVDEPACGDGPPPQLLLLQCGVEGEADEALSFADVLRHRDSLLHVYRVAVEGRRDMLCRLCWRLYAVEVRPLRCVVSCRSPQWTD
jgi:hypothetical protein